MTSKVSKEFVERQPFTSNASKTWRQVLLALGGALLVGLVFGLFDGTGHWTYSWFVYSLLAFLGLTSLIWLEGRLTIDPQVKKIALAAYFVRLALGLFLFLFLPIAGYQDNQASRAGYVFQDAFVRDNQAWLIVHDGLPLSYAYQAQATGDQYGGLLATTAFFYRYLSPDAHRPLLILFINAMVASWGVLCLWKAARDWFGKSIAFFAAWIFALYPESILLGASQMREPFIFTGIAIAFFGLIEMRKGSRAWPAWLLFAAALLLFIHPPSGLIAFLVLFLAWLFDPHRQVSLRRILTFGVILVLGLLIVLYFWSSLPSLQGTNTSNVFLTWLQNNFQFQTFRLERASGMFQKMMDDTQGQFKLAIVLGYGLVQPVLPAAIIEPTTWIWKLIVILRSLGWYFLAPFLGYALIASFGAKENDRRRQLILFGMAIWVWALISAATAGGNQWDNVRYRTDFIAIQAVLAGWAWSWARARKDPWLVRFLLVEAVFVLVFTVWYIGRYLLPALHLGLWVAIGLTLVLSVAVLTGSWLWEQRRLR